MSNSLMERVRAAFTPTEKRDKLLLTAAELDKMGVERKGLDNQPLSVSKELAAAMTGATKMTEEDATEMAAGLGEALMAVMNEKGYATDDNRDEMMKAVVEVTERMLGQMRDDAELAAAADDDKADDAPDDAGEMDEEVRATVKAMGDQLADMTESVKAIDALAGAVVTMAEGFAAFVDAQDAADTEIQALKAHQQKLDAMLAQTPRQASTAADTVVTDDDEVLTKAASQITIEELKSRFGYDPTAGGGQ